MAVSIAAQRFQLTCALAVVPCARAFYPRRAPRAPCADKDRHGYGYILKKHPLAEKQAASLIYIYKYISHKFYTPVTSKKKNHIKPLCNLLVYPYRENTS